MNTKLVVVAMISAAFVLGPNLVLSKSAEEKLARKSGCFKCHAIKKKKDGPSYQEIAEKWKVKADAEAKLFEHLTTDQKVEVEGKEQDHKKLKTDDEAEIRAVVKWILAN